MAGKRRRFNPAFKSRVALEALKEQRTISELAQKYSLHPTQINLWKKQLLEGAEPGPAHQNFAFSSTVSR